MFETRPGTGGGGSIHPRALAHLGDAVYELHIRQQAIRVCPHVNEALHDFTIRRVKAETQACVLAALEAYLTDAEKELVRQGRNMPVSVSRRSSQALYRQATALEALIGHLFLVDPARLETLWPLVDAALESC